MQQTEICWTGEHLYTSFLGVPTRHPQFRKRLPEIGIPWTMYEYFLRSNLFPANKRAQHQHLRTMNINTHNKPTIHLFFCPTRLHISKHPHLTVQKLLKPMKGQLPVFVCSAGIDMVSSLADSHSYGRLPITNGYVITGYFYGIIHKP